MGVRGRLRADYLGEDVRSGLTPYERRCAVYEGERSNICSEYINLTEGRAMNMGSNLKKLINKLEERGVISNRRAKALYLLVKLLESPVGRLVRYMVVKAIAGIIIDSIDGR